MTLHVGSQPFEGIRSSLALRRRRGGRDGSREETRDLDPLPWVEIIIRNTELQAAVQAGPNDRPDGDAEKRSRGWRVQPAMDGRGPMHQ